MTAHASILIVDDDSSARQAIVKLLQDDFYVVSDAATASDARQLLSRTHFDVVLCNLTLPDGAGLDVLQHARTLSPQIQVVMITSGASYGAIVEAIRSGASDYVQTPVSRERLRVVMAKALERSRASEERPPGVTQTRRALIVDDDVVALRVTSNMLTSVGFAPYQAATYAEAIEILTRERETLDVALIDAILPDGNGIDLLADMRKRRLMTPSIVVTACADVATAVAALHGGAFDFLAKPIRQEILTAAVLRAYQHRAALIAQQRVEAQREEYRLRLEHLSDHLEAKVTEQTRELAQLQQFLLSITESLPEGIVVVDLDGRISAVNASACAIVGQPKDAIVGRAIGDVPVLSPMRAPLLTVARTGTSANLLEAKVTARSGQPMILGFGVAPLRASPDAPTTGALAHFTDITAKKALEEHLARSDKLISLGMFAAGMAHDINNSLAITLGFLELALDPEAVPVERTSHMEKVLANVYRCRDIVKGILSVSRMDKGEVGPVDLQRIASDIVALLERQFHLAGVKLSSRCSSPVTITGNRVEVEQILFNLLTNARDACKQRLASPSDLGENGDAGGSGPASKPYRAQIELSVELQGDWALLKVTDNGVGMTADQLANVFKSFYTTKEVGQGTGLGLSICSSIVQRYGGHIEVQSEPHQGTTFSIRLPAATTSQPRTSRMTVQQSTPPPPVEPAQRPAAQVGRSALRILVVDDEPDIRQYCRLILEKAQHCVTVCEPGESALRDALEGAYDLLLVDLKMPGIDGLEMIRVLKRDRSDLPVIVMTGSAEIMASNVALDCGVRAVLQKPFEGELLLKEVARIARP